MMSACPLASASFIKLCILCLNDLPNNFIMATAILATLKILIWFDLRNISAALRRNAAFALVFNCNYSVLKILFTVLGYQFVRVRHTISDAISARWTKCHRVISTLLYLQSRNTMLLGPGVVPPVLSPVPKILEWHWLFHPWVVPSSKFHL